MLLLFLFYVLLLFFVIAVFIFIDITAVVVIVFGAVVDVSCQCLPLYDSIVILLINNTAINSTLIDTHFACIN